MQLTIEKMTRRDGVGGSYAYDVALEYRLAQWAEQEIVEKLRVTFVSSVYGAPAVMILPSGQAVMVTQWRQFGDVLGPQWIENFYNKEMAA